MVRIFDEQTEEVLYDSWSDSLGAALPTLGSNIATDAQATFTPSKTDDPQESSRSDNLPRPPRPDNLPRPSKADNLPMPPAPPKAAAPSHKAGNGDTRTSSSTPIWTFCAEGADQNAPLELFRHIQLYLNIGWVSLGSYERLFGRISLERPWGSHFWKGMAQALADYPWPRHGISPVIGFFETPATFSKANARQAKCHISNPGGGKFYPTYLWRSGCQILDETDEEIWVACLWLLIRPARPWRVHVSWVQEFWVIL